MVSRGWIANSHTIGYEGSRFMAYYHFNGWCNWSLGAHICLAKWNAELHVPGGFIRIGRTYDGTTLCWGAHNREHQEFMEAIETLHRDSA